MEGRRKVSPSLMCGNWLEIGDLVRLLETEGTDYLHIDMMDGHFVKNYGFTPDAINQLKKITELHLDIHLMVEDPISIIERLKLDESDIVSFHIEPITDVHSVIDCIEKSGATPGIALLPQTAIERVIPYFSRIHVILQMMTIPGFYGKSMEVGMLDKLEAMRGFIDRLDVDIELSVDGSVNFDLAPKMAEAGASIFVAGSSSVFGKNETIEENLERFKTILDVIKVEEAS